MVRVKLYQEIPVDISSPEKYNKKIELSHFTLDEQEQIIAFIQKLNEISSLSMLPENPEKTLPVEADYGTLNIIPAGPAKGKNINDAFAELRYTALAYIIFGAPRWEGTEDPIFHGVPLLDAIDICKEAITFFLLQDLNSEEAVLPFIDMLPEEARNIDKEKSDLIVEIMTAFTDFVRIFYEQTSVIERLNDVRIPYEGYGQTIRKLYTDEGETGLLKLIMKASKNGLVFKPAIQYLLELHKFVGWNDYDALATLYTKGDKMGSPEKLLDSINKRMSEYLNQDQTVAPDLVT